MMIAVQLGHKREFDALWNWSNTYMLITDPKNPNNGYFAWSMNTDGTPRSTGPAPDGEEYYAMALLFAARRWGNGHGIYDYQAQADRILHLMRHHAVETATGPFRIHPDDPPFIFDPAKLTSPNITERQQADHNLAIELKGEGKTPPPPPHWPMHPDRPETSGPMLDEAHTMVKFVPGPYGNFTDASYHLPAFYELFARWGPAEDRDFWLHAADVSRNFFIRVANPNTGLAPDRSNFDFSADRRSPTASPSPSATTPGAPPATGPSTIAGGTKTRARPRSPTTSRPSSSARASARSSTATPSMASRSRCATPRACSRPPPSPASPPRPAPTRKPSSTSSGTPPSPTASSATSTACST